MKRNWIRLRTDLQLRDRLMRRAEVHAAIRRFFAEEGFLEVDAPCLVPLPGMEPHLQPMSVELVDDRGGKHRFYLHTSPEYALKKLLSAGFEKIFSLGHVFRNGELSETHNPEFTLLEWYRAGTDYRSIMRDCESLVLSLMRRLDLGTGLIFGDGKLDMTPPWPRLTLAAVMKEYAGIDLDRVVHHEQIVEIAGRKGYPEVTPAWPWEDIFYRIFLQEVEPHLPADRPYFLVDYPVEMAALARTKPGHERWVERFELYAGGLELGNAFSELIDVREQEERLQREKAARVALNREVYPVDCTFLEALQRGMPPSAGIALGVDRLLMLLLNASHIREVMPFPVGDLLEELRLVRHTVPSWEKMQNKGVR
jgi:lysyl-tRNA synthetase class 2